MKAFNNRNYSVIACAFSPFIIENLAMLYSKKHVTLYAEFDLQACRAEL